MNRTFAGSAFHLITVRGIPIRIHISLPILLGFFFLRNLDLGPRYAVRDLIISLLIFVGIGLHELGHSFTAMHFGHRVQDIVLTLIGGMARMTTMPRNPRQEILVAIAGPAVSVIVGVVLIGLGYLVGLARAPQLWMLTSALIIAGVINFILAFFNLIPAFPMDGGRVFRASLSKRLGRLKATELAMRVGQGVSILFILSGLFGFEGVPLFSEPSFIRVFIGFFIFNAARAEYQMVLTEETLRSRGFTNPLEVILGGKAQQQGPPPPPRMRWRPPTPEADIPDDTVEVGPSPYEKGRPSRTHIERD